jgi:GNAT superfamily N-acetyltransferase
MRTAEIEDIPCVTAVMATAFHSDPVWGAYSFPDEATRLDVSTRFWEPQLRATLRFGMTHVTPECEAAAVWVPPGEPELTPEQEQEVAALVVDLVGEPQAEVILDVFDRLDAAHPHHRDHYYLSLLGTHTDHRGRGLGMGLLAAGLELIDAEGMPAYLESTNNDNDRRYARLGFEPFGVVELPNGHRITTMWREARPPGERGARAVPR